MSILLIFVWVLAAFVALAFWESSVEGRNPWDQGKHGWKIKLAKNITLSLYHFFLFWIMMPLLLTLPLVIFGWDLRLFGVLVSAFFLGLIVEDFMWYVVNPVVKFREWFSGFSDYYPWIRIKGKKIVPVYYLIGILIALASWWFLWK